MALTNVLVTVTDRDSKKIKEKFIADNDNIRTLQGFMKGQWNLALFDDCFRGNNRLGDIDASIELGGHTLLVEFKESKWSMTKGQTLKAIRQAKYSNIVTFFVFGKRDNPEGYLQITPAPACDEGFVSSGYVEATLDSLSEHIAEWSKQAEVNNLVEDKTKEWNEVSSVLRGM